MHRSLFVIALLGCGEKPPPSTVAGSGSQASGSPASGSSAAGSSGSASGSASTDGVARAARASLPRADWPCARRWIVDGKPNIVRLEWAAIDRCVVPLELFAYGLGGCPAKRLDEEIKYDAQGRVVESSGIYTYRWGDRGLIAKVIRDLPIPFHDAGQEVVLGTDDQLDEKYQFDPQGRLSRTTVYGPGSIEITHTTYEYTGERVARFLHRSLATGHEEKIELLYDCSKL